MDDVQGDAAGERERGERRFRVYEEAPGFRPGNRDDVAGKKCKALPP